MYHDGPNGNECEGNPVYSTTMDTDSDGNEYRNSAGPRPEVGDFVRVCRLDPAAYFNPNSVDRDDLIAILSGVLVKGGKEKNKPNRCR